MRTTKDRIRHAICFEIIGLILVTLLGSWIFGIDMHNIGVVAAVGTAIAMFWNYAYNLLFDHAMLWALGTVHKSFLMRILHAVLFEMGILVLLLPFIAWYMGIGLIDAFIMDLYLSAFYIVYAFIFNWGYDRIFPIPPIPQPEHMHR